MAEFVRSEHSPWTTEKDQDSFRFYVRLFHPVGKFCEGDCGSCIGLNLLATSVILLHQETVGGKVPVKRAGPAEKQAFWHPLVKLYVTEHEQMKPLDFLQSDHSPNTNGTEREATTFRSYLYDYRARLGEFEPGSV